MSSHVTAERIQIALDFGLVNVGTAAFVCRDVGLPFWAACALLEKESRGANVFGHDTGGVHSYPDRRVIEVTPELYVELLVKVMNGAISNGVGPCQITYAGSLVNCTGGNGRNGGFFKEMSEQHLLPWVVEDNMFFGFGKLAGYKNAAEGRTWFSTSRLYNGKESYGRDFVVKANEWRERLNIKGGPVE